jgi:hypothetical protein
MDPAVIVWSNSSVSYIFYAHMKRPKEDSNQIQKNKREPRLIKLLKTKKERKKIMDMDSNEREEHLVHMSPKMTAMSIARRQQQSPSSISNITTPPPSPP